MHPSTPENTRTPQETPAEHARAVARLATAPLANFGEMINDDARDQHWQKLVTRVTDDWPALWSRANEDDAIDRLAIGGLPTEENRALFRKYDSHRADETAIREEAAYLVGLEVGRQQTPPSDDGLTPALRATLARGDCLARFHEVERFSVSWRASRDASGGDIPINSVGMEFVADAAGSAGLTLRKLRQEVEAAGRERAAQPAAG